VYLLDTDHIGILQRQTGTEYVNLSQHLLYVPASDVFTSIVSFQEQVVGWQAFLNKARSPESVILAYAMFERILADFADTPKLSFDAVASKKFQELRAARIRVGTLDLRIAAIALTRNCTLLTRNVVDFAQVPELRYEDWTK
jgi:tRNA(fMet)-specific endonuclease VapC